MKITKAVSGGALRIKLTGEMDEYSARGIRESCDKLIESGTDVDRIIIDLSEVAFMDSTGIGFLIGRYKKARRANVPLFVEQPNPTADKILTLSGVYSLIPKAENQ